MNIVRKLDAWLNGITMYRLLAYGLSVLAAASIVLAFWGWLSLPVGGMLVSLAVLLATCYLANRLLSRIWQVASNTESWLITALILFLILPPASTPGRAVGVFVAGLLAMAAKYLLALQGRHLFNPAAVAAVLVGLFGLVHATWWVGSAAMLPLTLALGLLVVRKVRRFGMLLGFAGASLLALLVVGALEGRPITDVLVQAITSGPLVFLGSIMLTEPTTTPPRNVQRLVYGALVGGLFAAQLRAGPFALTPEIALLLGNIFSYVVSPKYRLRMRLKEIRQLSARVYDLSFEPDRAFTFMPGQYLEWTLPHSRPDARGNRRTFSIASSPTEQEVHIGIKCYEPSSTFKTALRALQPGSMVSAGQLAGDFVLPRAGNQKLVFIAGGIGITPFRSMLKYIIDTQQKRDIVLFYVVSDPQEISYADVLRQAEACGLRLVKVLGAKEVPADWDGRVGFLTSEIISQDVPDYAERLFYLSGPNAMVENYRYLLRTMGVARSRIKSDYFSGY